MKTSPYKLHQQSLSVLKQSLNAKAFPEITLCHGSSTFLINQTVELMKAHWRNSHKLPVSKHNCKELSPSEFLPLIEQQSIFDDASLQVITQCEKQKKIASLLETLQENLPTSNRFLLSYYYPNKAPTKILNSFKKMGAIEVICPNPSPYEMRDFTKDLAKQHLLNLDQSAINLLLELVGNNLVSLDQELRRLSLVFAATKQINLKATDISPHLNMISESIAFKLRTLILDQKKSQAHCLLVDLLNRGESPLAILGILAKHCRNAINIQTAKQNSLASSVISQKYRLQNYLVNHYIKYVSRVNQHHFKAALHDCHEADKAIKTGSRNESLLLSNIIEGLC